MKRKWKIGIAALCGAVVLTAGFAAAAAGSQDDPLITLSYLKNVFTGQVQTMVDEAVSAGQAQNKSAMDAAIQEWDAEIGQAVQDALNAQVKEEPASFEAASMADGKTITVVAGCEVIVRSGEPVCSADLIDQTDGTMLKAGEKLTANHLYLAVDACKFSILTPVVTGVVTASPSLSVRAGAGTSYSRLGTIAKGTVVTIVDSSVEGWYMITGGGLAGYVSAEYVEVNPTASSGPASFLIKGEYTVE